MAKLLLALLMAGATISLIALYCFELWVYFTDRGNFAKRVTLKITYDENGERGSPGLGPPADLVSRGILLCGGFATYFALNG